MGEAGHCKHGDDACVCIFDTDRSGCEHFVAVATPDRLLDAAKRVLAAHDEVNAWMALGWPARTLVAEPSRTAAAAAFQALRAAVTNASQSEGVQL